MTRPETTDSATLEARARDIDAATPSLASLLVALRPGHVYRDALAILERPLLVHVLRLTRGNHLRAAQLLGLDRATLRRRCRALGIYAIEIDATPPCAPTRPRAQHDSSILPR